ncbi:TLR1 protein, partial [Amia calva]|nr:TLR1 protein [Amia calva]
MILDISSNLYGSYALGNSFKNFLFLRYLALGSPNARSINATDFGPLQDKPLKELSLGDGLGLDSYESGSFTRLQFLEKLTLRMTFCERSQMFHIILKDLDETQVQSLNLIQFLPNFCNVSIDPFVGLKGMRSLTKISFVDTWFNSSVMTKLLLNIFETKLEVLGFFNITYNEDTPEGIVFPGIPGYNQSHNVKAVIFDNVHHYQYTYPKININVTFFSQITYVKFSGTGMNISPCNLISSLPSLEVLDLSNNLLTDHGFWWFGCSYTNVFPALRRLSLRNNKFQDLDFISERTQQMKTLDTLDLSFNSIKLNGPCTWSPQLTSLSLSNNDLGNSIFSNLSPYIRSLNLSKTGITELNQEALSLLPNLTHLFLSSNTIRTLPTNLWAPRLEVLHVDQNNILTMSKQSLGGLRGLKQLKASNNPFSCTCDSYWFVTAFNKSLLLDWPSQYTCNAPSELAGKTLNEYQPSRASCDPGLRAAIAVPLIVVSFAVLGLVFHMFDGAWYLRMLWVWMRVKQRGYQGAKRLSKGAFHYHAFISYSQIDSSWVDSQLVPNLECTNFSLCIHERDFMPGDWIIDNIINCVESSYKTLFVLSRNFVQSEWCNYELFFAHHRALSIKEDSLVFILLEPIPADSLPRKFLRLRTLLQQRTYLEWPEEEGKRRIFWASLKAMLQVADDRILMKQVAREIAESCPLLSDTD